MFIEPYLANVTIFAGNFAPRGWMFCQGQLLAIAQYDALFALIGTTYGGDGQSTFALPDLRGRRANHQGQGPGLSNYTLGQISGTENITLLNSNIATHNHTVSSLAASPGASTDTNGSATPGNGVVPASGQMIYSQNEGYNMASFSGVASTVIAGGSQPVTVMNPYLAMNYIIAVEGIFPSRN